MKGCIQPSDNHAAVAPWIMQPHAKLWFERKTTELYSKRCNYEKLVKIQSATAAHLGMHFFLRCRVFSLQRMFLKFLAPIRPRYGPDTVPIRPRYGPDTAPIRPWYVLDTATGVHFSKKLTAKGWHFFKKSEIYKNWTELSAVKSLGLNCLVICFAFANFTWWKNGWICVKMKKCETKHPEDICCWRNASGKKAAWKQRRGFWGRSSNVSICVCCMSFKQSKTLCGSFLRLFFLVNLHRESMQEKHMWIPADAPAQFTMWTLTGLATHLLQKQNTSHPKILLHNPRENTTT